jgi:hypothetical protein
MSAGESAGLSALNARRPIGRPWTAARAVCACVPFRPAPDHHPHRSL